jgi:glucokinase
VLTIGVDIGGTKIAGGVVDEAGRVLDVERRNTPHADPQAMETALVDVVGALARRHDVGAAGIGVAAFINVERSTVLFSPNLALRDVRLAEAVADRMRMPIVVENDANAAAWGEFRFGAGRGRQDVVMVAVGTGIGGGVVLGGELYRGGFGMAAEFGHMRVVPNGHVCGCGNKGCWEQYASGNALVREARELVAAGSPMAAGLLAAAGGNPATITGPMVTTAARAGDGLAVELLERIGRWLGEGIAMVAAALDPLAIVVGGGVSEAEELLLGPARTAYRASLSGRRHRPELEIRLAHLGNRAGLVGAADLARR